MEAEADFFQPVTVALLRFYKIFIAPYLVFTQHEALFNRDGLL